MRASRTSPVAAASSPTLETGSTASMLQSSRPTAASENRLLAGDASLTRARLSVDDRSVPYHGAARAPFAGLRVVATRSTGSDESPDTSKPGAVAAIPAQPASPSADAADASPRNTARREAAPPDDAR